MARVYCALSPDGDRVALKVVKGDFADETFRRRFDREARMAAKVQHRHVVPVLDAGERDGVPYLVQQFVAGGTLAERIKGEGRLGVDETVTLCGQIGAGLDALHAHGLVHRDLKPGNVLLDEERNAYITDFGLAKDHALERAHQEGPDRGFDGLHGSGAGPRPARRGHRRRLLAGMRPVRMPSRRAALRGPGGDADPLGSPLRRSTRSGRSSARTSPPTWAGPSCARSRRSPSAARRARAPTPAWSGSRRTLRPPVRGPSSERAGAHPGVERRGAPCRVGGHHRAGGLRPGADRRRGVATPCRRPPDRVRLLGGGPGLLERDARERPAASRRPPTCPTETGSRWARPSCWSSCGAQATRLRATRPPAEPAPPAPEPAPPAPEPAPRPPRAAEARGRRAACPTTRLPRPIRRAIPQRPGHAGGPDLRAGAGEAARPLGRAPPRGDDRLLRRGGGDRHRGDLLLRPAVRRGDG